MDRQHHGRRARRKRPLHSALHLDHDVRPAFLHGADRPSHNPLVLLFSSSVLAVLGLYTLGSVKAALDIMAAATIYGAGKTFFWPTTLGVVSKRLPSSGALTLGAIGGVGMLSAGLLGGPGIAPEVALQFHRSDLQALKALPGKYEGHQGD